MPKNKKRSPFMCFAMDFKTRRGGNNMSVSEAVQAAGPHWEKMSTAERAPYEKQAKEDGGRIDSKPVERYTSLGIKVSQIERENMEKAEKQARMKREIEEIVQNAFLNNQINEQPFYFIAVNYFCKRDNDYYPAELSIAKYTIKDGDVKTYHTYLNPEKLPMGYTFIAREHSQDTHRLPQPPKAFGERELNWSNILMEIFKFCNCTSVDIPILYTQRDQIDVVENTLAKFCAIAQEEIESFRIYPITQLFYVLKEESCKNGFYEDTSFKSIHIAEAIIQKDKYDYHPDIACQYHEEEDAGKFCTLSMVKRWGFVVSEHIVLTMEPVKKSNAVDDDDDELDNNHDDDKSCISQNTYLSTAASSITAPIKFQHKWEMASNQSTISEATTSWGPIKREEKDFPPLGGRQFKNRKVLNDSDDDDDKDDDADANENYGRNVKHKSETTSTITTTSTPSVINPWSRQVPLPREPSETSSIFSTHKSSGRGIIADNKPIQLALGRGKGFRQ